MTINVLVTIHFTSIYPTMHAPKEWRQKCKKWNWGKKKMCHFSPQPFLYPFGVLHQYHLISPPRENHVFSLFLWRKCANLWWSSTYTYYVNVLHKVGKSKIRLLKKCKQADYQTCPSGHVFYTCMYTRSYVFSRSRHIIFYLSTNGIIKGITMVMGRKCAWDWGNYSLHIM